MITQERFQEVILSFDYMLTRADYIKLSKLFLERSGVIGDYPWSASQCLTLLSHMEREEYENELNKTISQ